MNSHNHFDSISVLNFSTRSYNALMREGICSIGDLLSCKKDDIIKIHQLGVKSIEEITRVVDELNSSKIDIYSESNEISEKIQSGWRAAFWINEAVYRKYNTGILSGRQGFFLYCL